MAIYDANISYRTDRGSYEQKRFAIHGRDVPDAERNARKKLGRVASIVSIELTPRR